MFKDFVMLLSKPLIAHSEDTQYKREMGQMSDDLSEKSTQKAASL